MKGAGRSVRGGWPKTWASPGTRSGGTPAFAGAGSEIAGGHRGRSLDRSEHPSCTPTPGTTTVASTRGWRTAWCCTGSWGPVVAVILSDLVQGVPSACQWPETFSMRTWCSNWGVVHPSVTTLGLVTQIELTLITYFRKSLPEPGQIGTRKNGPGKLSPGWRGCVGWSRSRTMGTPV